jgi:hypothetical protein
VIRIALLIAAALPALAACSSIGDFTGAVAGGATGLVSANPVVGYGIGIGVRAGTDATVNYVLRKRQQAEQDAIAVLAGPLEPGASRPWQINHDIPIGNEHGTLTVIRAIRTPLTLCKEIAFSVENGEPPDAKIAWFTTTACQQNKGWKWAEAEPAIERWGNLQ